MIKRWFVNLSMASRLSLAFLGLVISTLALVELPASFLGLQQLWQAYNTQLENSALDKQTNLQNWFDNIKVNLTVIGDDPELARLLDRYNNPDQPPLTANERDQIVNDLATWTNPNSDFIQISVLDWNAGRIIFTSDPMLIGTSIPPTQLARDFNSASFGPVFFAGQPPQPEMYISYKIIDGAGNSPLILVARLNLKHVQQIVDLRNANQQSDESLLINQQRELVVAPRLGAGRLAVGQIIDTEAANQCVQGHDGQVQANDYRGVPAIIVYRWMPSLQLCLEAKLDQSEIYAQGTSLSWAMAAVTLLAIAAAILAALYFSRQLARPLNELVYGVEAFGRGELRLRLPVHSRDEIGRLRAAFNDMASNLQQTLDRLYESQERYRRLAEGTFEGLMFSENEMILDINPQLAWMFGYQPDELIGRSVYSAVAEDSRPVVKEHILSNYDRPYEFNGLHKDGSMVPVEEHGHLTLYEGRMVRLSAIRDLSAQKKAEAAQARLLSILEATPDIVSTTSPDGNYLYLNRAGRRMLGYSDDADITRLTFRSVHPEWANLVLMQEGIPTAVRDGVWEGEVALIHKDGAEIPVSKVIIAHCDENGQLEYLSTLNRDISARKRMENELRAARDELEQRVEERTRELDQQTRELARSNAELEQFAYVASHDLQEPLRMITSYLQLIQRRYQGKIDTDADDYIHFAVDGAHRLKLLINDLLAFSRVGTRGKAFKLTNLNELVGQICMSLQLAIHDTGAEVSIADLPVVMGDAVQLTQLLQNLLSNALKFHGERPLQVRIWAEARDGDWLFGVRDNGIGIEPQYAERIFVIFQRLHTREEYPGTGIGLAVCKRIVERHGGRIWVESQLGQGATFYFTLPMNL
jgi:PAS domain S-box-containing protein